MQARLHAAESESQADGGKSPSKTSRVSKVCAMHQYRQGPEDSAIMALPVPALRMSLTILPKLGHRRDYSPLQPEDALRSKQLVDSAAAGIRRGTENDTQNGRTLKHAALLSQMSAVAT